MNRYTICVDFDGVLHEHTSPWVNQAVIPDPPVPNAIEWLTEMERHFEVVVFTTRARTAAGESAVYDWLVENGFPRDASVTVTDRKPPALIYIDDRGWRFEGVFPSKDQIFAARPWNK